MSITIRANAMPTVQRKGPANAYARLDALGTEKLDLVRNRLANGDDASSIARLIQGEWQMMTDVKEVTLSAQLRRYKAAYVEIKPPSVKKLEAQLEKAATFDTLAELERVYSIQMARINMAHTRETDAKMLLPMVGGELIRARDMLTTIQKVRFELGIDAFNGPMAQTGKVTRSTTVGADGSTTHSEVREATQIALSVLDKYRDSETADAQESPSAE